MHLYVFFSIISILRTISKTHLILAQILKESNADFELISYEILILIIKLLTRKIAKTNNILAPNFGGNHADIIYI
jgi:hypothetical protein